MIRARQRHRSSTIGLLRTREAINRSWFPAGVTHLTITAYGANGASGVGYSPSFGGIGGTVTATIPVTPGERLAIVGGNGGDNGFNGRGALRSHGGCNCNSQGGGASDVRQGGDRLTDR